MKVALCEVQKNLQVTNSDGKETGTQINDLERNEETRIQKHEERLSNPWDNFKCSNIQIMECRKEKRKSKKLKTYLKK